MPRLSLLPAPHSAVGHKSAPTTALHSDHPSPDLITTPLSPPRCLKPNTLLTRHCTHGPPWCGQHTDPVSHRGGMHLLPAASRSGPPDTAPMGHLAPCLHGLGLTAPPLRSLGSVLTPMTSRLWQMLLVTYFPRPFLSQAWSQP